MAKYDLFPDINQYREPLTIDQRRNKADVVIKRAELGLQYMYNLQDAAGICHMSYDEMQTAIHTYRIDATRILTAVRIPWWSLAEYLLDPADDVEQELNEWMAAIPHRSRQVLDLQLKKAS
jgi:hypothetical protein